MRVLGPVPHGPQDRQIRVEFSGKSEAEPPSGALTGYSQDEAARAAEEKTTTIIITTRIIVIRLGTISLMHGV